MDPLIATLKEVVEIHSIILAQNWVGNPTNLSIHSKNSQEMESYALCKSIFKMHLGEILLWAYFRRSSWTRKMLSIIFLFLRKADWDSPIIISSTRAIRFAKILDTILYNKLWQQIGLKWFTWEAWSVLGMRAKWHDWSALRFYLKWRIHWPLQRYHPLWCSKPFKIIRHCSHQDRELYYCPSQKLYSRHFAL